MPITSVVRKTSFTPEDALVGHPTLFCPRGAEIDVSVVFTSDIPEARQIADEYRQFGNTVRIGGPALDDPGGEFEPGRYIKRGVTITHRGCIRKCPFCYVPKREGGIRELQIKPGNILNDNNILACSKNHRRKVWDMLRTQKNVSLRGGIDARLMNTENAGEIKSLKLFDVWLASDSDGVVDTAVRAIKMLSPIPRDKIRCYVLMGFGADTPSLADDRARAIYEAGALPFAQLYDRVADRKPWQKLIRYWSRPAIYKSKHIGEGR